MEGNKCPHTPAAGAVLYSQIKKAAGRLGAHFFWRFQLITPDSDFSVL